MSLSIFPPFTEVKTITKKVTSPQRMAIRLYGAAVSAELYIIHCVAVPERLSPMHATIGPMMTAGSSLFSQLVPTNLITMAMITYTSPAKPTPMISPQ